MNWCRQSTRLSIYLRDGLACQWCGRGVEQGVRLTLDHLTPVSDGGSNDPSNLVTACVSCNSARGTMAVAAFARECGGGPDTERRVRNAARRAPCRGQALAILAERTLADALRVRVA